MIYATFNKSGETIVLKFESDIAKSVTAMAAVHAECQYGIDDGLIEFSEQSISDFMQKAVERIRRKAMP